MVTLYDGYILCDMRQKTHYVVKKHKNPLYFSLYLSIMVKDGFNGDSVWRNEYAEFKCV